MTNEQLQFKELIERQKCKTHNQSAELIISQQGHYDGLKNVCCEEFRDILTDMIMNQIADETSTEIGSW